PIEPVEHVRALLAGNARPSISDSDRGSMGVVAHRYLDIARPTMLDRIIEQIGDRLEQEIPVTEYGDSSRALKRHVTTPFFGRCIEELRDVARHLSQVDDAECVARIQCLDPRDPKQ